MELKPLIKITEIWNMALEQVIFRFRWIFVLWVLVPLDQILDAWQSFRNWLVYKLDSAPRAHERKVAVIQRQIREWNETGRKQQMCTARPGWHSISFRTPKYKQNCTKIKTDQLMDILKIDTEKEVIRVEPMVKMAEIVKRLLPLGYTLAVVPELDSLTVGGLINGAGVESSGIKFGLFQHICLEFEMVMADGSLVVTTKERGDQSSDNQALFYAVPWSHGTLGFLVAATLRIIPCKPLVKLTYTPCNSLKDLTKTLTKESTDRDNDFVEALAFTNSSGVVVAGRLASLDRGISVNRIGSWWKRWFYVYVREILARGQTKVEYVPIKDYYFRHSKSLFWETKDIIPFGNHWLFRYFMGWALPLNIGLLKLTTPKPLKNFYEKRRVIEDLLVPIEKVTDTVHMLHEEVEIYPLWLCPFVLPSNPGALRQRSGKNLLFVDVGVYGSAGRKCDYTPRKTLRNIEKFVRSVGGFQLLYADTFMTREEFWEMFDSSMYDWLRVKYGCKDAFPNLYDKVSRFARE